MARPSSPLWDVPSNRRDAPSQPLGEQVAGSAAVGVGGSLQRRFQRQKQGRLHVFAKGVLEGKGKHVQVLDFTDLIMQIRFL